MQLTPGNKARFDEILKRYPVKRSALLPALHLVQEQEGWISREAIEHVAGLLDLTPAQVHDTASFYTMFRLKPEGKTLIEVCTTLSCALGGAEELLEHTCRKLGIEPGRHDAGRQVHGQGRRVPGRVRRGARGAGERRVARARDRGRHRPRDRGRDRAPQLRVAEEPGRAHPLPERLEGGLDLARRLRGLGRLREARRVAEADARGDHRRGQEVEPARARRGGLPDRDEVGLPAQGQPEAALPVRERRRERARDLQGPGDHRARPAPADRGDRGELPRDPLADGLHLHPRRVPRGRADPGGGARGGAGEGLRREEHPRHRRRRRDPRPPRRGLLRVRRGDGPHRVARGQARPAAHQAALPGGGRASTAARRSSTTSRRS